VKPCASVKDQLEKCRKITTPIFTLSVRKAVFMGTRKEAQFQENAGYGSAGQGQPLFLEECKTF
jgi:hypothetical protein